MSFSRVLKLRGASREFEYFVLAGTLRPIQDIFLNTVARSPNGMETCTSIDHALHRQADAIDRAISQAETDPVSVYIFIFN